MKKCICIILVIAVSILSGCNSSQNEENVFPQNFKEYYEVSPYGNEEEINSLSDVEITLDKINAVLGMKLKKEEVIECDIFYREQLW